MPNENHKCSLSLVELTTTDNIDEFILVNVITGPGSCSYYFIHSSIKNQFFCLDKCPNTRAEGEYKALYLKDLSDELKELVDGLADNTEFNLFFAKEELQSHIKTGTFTFKKIAINPTTTLQEFENLLASYPLQMNAIIVPGSATLLHYFALLAKNTEFVEALIAAGANKEAKTKNGQTPLHWAAQDVQTKTTLALINAGADIETKDNSGSTPLHLAAQLGKTATVNSLIERGAKIEAKNNSGSTPLHLAAQLGKTATVNSLIERGAKIEAKNNDGYTPLHLAAVQGHSETVIALIERHANIEAKDSNDSTPLHLAAQDGQTATALALIDAGANKEAKGNNGWTPLHWAALQGHSETVLALITAGADIEAKDNSGHTPLHAATAKGHTEAVNTLIELGADINAKDEDGMTPMHWAAKKEFAEVNKVVEVINALIAAKADINAKSYFGFTPLHLAIINGKTEIVQALIDQGASVKGGWGVLLFATLCGETEAVKTVMAEKTSDIQVKEIIPHLVLYLIFVLTLLLAAHFVPQVFLFLTGSLLGYFGLIQNLPVIQAAILSLLSIPLLDYLYNRMTPEQDKENAIDTGEKKPLESGELDVDTSANTSERRAKDPAPLESGELVVGTSVNTIGIRAEGPAPLESGELVVGTSVNTIGIRAEGAAGGPRAAGAA
jgi:ankyrin repeat protein